MNMDTERKQRTTTERKEAVETLWKKYEKYKETAIETHPTLKLEINQCDQLMVPAYIDLQENWTDDHADLFIDAMEKIVFPRVGVK